MLVTLAGIVTPVRLVRLSNAPDAGDRQAIYAGRNGHGTARFGVSRDGDGYAVGIYGVIVTVA